MLAHLVGGEGAAVVAPTWRIKNVAQFVGESWGAGNIFEECAVFVSGDAERIMGIDIGGNAINDGLVVALLSKSAK